MEELSISVSQARFVGGIPMGVDANVVSPLERTPIKVDNIRRPLINSFRIRRVLKMSALSEGYVSQSIKPAHFSVSGVSYHAHVKARMADPLFDADSALVTPRERQCLGWASSGKTMQEMATILRVTPRVVKFHLDNGRRKLGASTLPHAVALALRRDLLP